MSAYQSFKDLDLTRDEIERLGSAFKNKEFRKLFSEYVDELHDPENRKLYQKEITELEKERGVDVTFLNPVAGYVIKTSVDGSKKCFINICSNDNIRKPSSIPAFEDGSKGLQWSIPHSLAPPREDVDKKSARCVVYDVIFHSDTLHLARNNKAFRNMVNKTACEAVESNFDVNLDKRNLKFPKLQYKGMPQASVIRKPSKTAHAEKDPEEQAIYDKLFAEVGNYSQPKSPRKSKPRRKGKSSDISEYTKPVFTIKHRTHVEMQEFTEHKEAKLHVAIPKELLIEINLPLLKSASDIILDVMEQSVHLVSEKPAKYKLEITLPYKVNEQAGNAKFEKDKKMLVITLPVARNNISIFNINNIDSGVESDHAESCSTSPTSEKPLISELHTECGENHKSEFRTSLVSFLDENVQYSLPDFTCHTFENIIAFTLNVKNVDESSVAKVFNEDLTSVHVKFVTISSGFFPQHYAFYLRLSGQSMVEEEVLIETWDNNVVLQVAFYPSEKKVMSYFVGTQESDVQRKFVEEASVLNSLLKDDLSKSENVDSDDDEEAPEVSSTDATAIPEQKEETKRDGGEASEDITKSDDVIEESKPSSEQLNIAEDNDINESVISESDAKEVPAEKETSEAINIRQPLHESSLDNLSCSYSPSRSKGILKSSGMTRSISESSIEDFLASSSFEASNASLESIIPEDGEMSTSLKKTVRFSDNVSRQLYRSNSSILGQKKKNQRKAKAKKRAHDRRCSESEASETDDKKEGDEKTQEEIEKEKVQHFLSDMFQLDM